MQTEAVVLEKGTSGYDGTDRLTLWAPMIKDINGKYAAILTDDSMDRDDEFIGKSALQDFVTGDYLAALLNHDNDVLNQVASWENRRVEVVKGQHAVIAEPKFFLSNPKAVQIKGMLDEGAQIGVSIGAIIKEHKTEKINGKEHKVYTKLEPVEASFVAVPANKHAHATMISKSLKYKTPEVQPTMDKTYTQENVDELTKQFEAEKADIKKSLDEAVAKNEAFKALDAEKTELTKNLEAIKAEKAELEKQVALHKEAAAKVTLMRGANVSEPGNQNNETVEEAQKAGKVLVTRRTP